MKIAIVVQGRFHAFDLVRALLRRGNKVTVFSNYPQWAVARFGIPASCVRSFSLHGVLTRIAERVREKTGLSFEASLHRMFSRWAARQLRGIVEYVERVGIEPRTAARIRDAARGQRRRPGRSARDGQR